MKILPALSNSVPLAEHIKLEKVAHNNLQLALHKETAEDS